MSPQAAGLSAVPGLQKPAAATPRAVAPSADTPSFDQCLQSDSAAANRKNEAASDKPSQLREPDNTRAEASPETTSAESSPPAEAPPQRRADRTPANTAKPEPAAETTAAQPDEAAPLDNKSATALAELTAVAGKTDADIGSEVLPSTENSGIALLMASLLAAPPAVRTDRDEKPSPLAEAPLAATSGAGDSAAIEARLSSFMRLNAAPTGVSSSSAGGGDSAALPSLAALDNTAPAAVELPLSTPTLAAPAPTTASANAPAAVILPANAMPVPPSGQWAEPLAERILWMAGDSVDGQPLQVLRQARIELHPAEWGAMQIRVELNADGRTKVSFDVETPQARAAIEASLPQLRDLLGTQTVHSAAPSFELSGGWSHQQRQAGRSSAPNASAHEETDEAVLLTPVRVSRGLVDQFA